MLLEASCREQGANDAQVTPPAPLQVMEYNGGQTEQRAPGRARLVQPGCMSRLSHRVQKRSCDTMSSAGSLATPRPAMCPLRI